MALLLPSRSALPRSVPVPEAGTGGRRCLPEDRWNHGTTTGFGQRFHSDWQPRSGHQCRRALPRVDQAGTRSWPQCHGHPVGFGFRSRLSPRLPDREARCLQPRIGVATSRGIILTAPSTTTMFSNTGRGAGGPSCLRNKEHHTENQPESHDLNYGDLEKMQPRPCGEFFFGLRTGNVSPPRNEAKG
jgi:hypothetical protein